METKLTHGTVIGFRHGCRSRGGCIHHRSAVFLTCVEATIARRGDFRIAAMPEDLPVSRSLTKSQSDRSRSDVRARSQADGSASKASLSRSAERAPVRRPSWRHGTATGYGRGCRSHERCPRGEGGLSCHEVRNAARLRLSRRAGVGPAEPSTTSELAREHIARLVGQGLSLRRIASLCGVGHTTVSNIANGTACTIRISIQAKILGLSDCGVVQAA